MKNNLFIYFVFGSHGWPCGDAWILWGYKSPVFYGSFWKRSSLCSPLTFMKTIYLFCFWFSSTLWIVAMEGVCLLLKSTWNILFLKHDLAETHESQSSPGSFWKSGGGRGGAPLVTLPSPSLTFMKTIYLFCFWYSWMTLWIPRRFFIPEVSLSFLKILFLFLEDDLLEIHSPEGAVSRSPVFYGSFWKSGGVQGRSPADVHPWSLPEFSKNIV